MSDQASDSPERPRPVAADADETITTLLGQGAEFAGKLSFEGTVRVDGKFTGEISSAGTLVVGRAAEIEADIDVHAVLIQGRLKGTVRATESIEIHAPARVEGLLIAPELHIARGVRFDGECRMSDAAPGKPAEPKAVDGKSEPRGVPIIQAEQATTSEDDAPVGEQAPPTAKMGNRQGKKRSRPR